MGFSNILITINNRKDYNYWSIKIVRPSSWGYSTEHYTLDQNTITIYPSKINKPSKKPILVRVIQFV